MSGPRRLRSRLRLARPKGFSRRDFLRRLGGAASLVMAQPLLTACGDSALTDTSGGIGGGGNPTTPRSTPFLHGVASGDPLANAVILWTRATPVTTEDIPVTVSVYRDAALLQLVGSAMQTATSARDWTIKIDFTGLMPGTTYYYRFTAVGFDSVVGRTKTLPVGNVERVRFGVTSCSSLAHGFFNAYRFLAERADIDVVGEGHVGAHLDARQ